MRHFMIWHSLMHTVHFIVDVISHDDVRVCISRRRCSKANATCVAHPSVVIPCRSYFGSYFVARCVLLHSRCVVLALLLCCRWSPCVPVHAALILFALVIIVAFIVFPPMSSHFSQNDAISSVLIHFMNAELLRCTRTCCADFVRACYCCCSFYRFSSDVISHFSQNGCHIFSPHPLRR